MGVELSASDPGRSLAGPKRLISSGFPAITIPAAPASSSHIRPLRDKSVTMQPQRTTLPAGLQRRSLGSDSLAVLKTTYTARRFRSDVVRDLVAGISASTIFDDVLATMR